MKQIFLAAILGFMGLKGMAQKSGDTIRVADDLKLVKISENVYVHISYKNIPEFGGVIPANGVVYINRKEAFLFDTPWTEDQTVMLVAYLKRSMHLRMVGFIPNHWHEDCIAGLDYLKKSGVPSYANEQTIKLALAHKYPVPEHAFTDSLLLKMGGKPIWCYYLGGAHSTDNIVVWLPSEQVLFAGCMVKELKSSNLGNTADGDLKAYPTTISRLLAKFPAAKIVIPGHGAWGGVELIRHTLQLAKQ